MKTLLFAQEFLIPIIIVVILLFSLLLFFIGKGLKNKKKSNVDKEFVSNLVEALGGINNISLVEVENRRLKLTLNDIKVINQAILKEVVKGAFVTKNIVKIIMQSEAEPVAQEIKLMKK